MTKGKTVRISDKDIMKISQNFDIGMRSEPGVRRVAYDQVNLAFFQKFDTADRCTVGDFDPDIRIRLVKFLKIFNQEIAADRVTGSDAKLSLEHVVA